MITETNLKCFLSLAKTLSFTKTASSLYMTQQAVSKNISKLEESLGLPLFDRSHHSVSLTPLGEQFYAMFSRFSNEYEAALREAHMNQKDNYRVLKLGYQNWLDFGCGPSRALAQMRGYASNHNLFLVGERHSPVILTEQLISQKMDIAIMYKRFAPQVPGLKMRTVFHSPTMLMISASNPLVTADATYQTFVEEPFIFDSFENEKAAEVNARARQCISDWSLRPRQVIIMPNRDSAYTAAELGNGFIITTEMNRIVKSSVLKKYPLGIQEAIVAIWRELPQDSIIEEYVEYLAKEYQ